MNVLLLRPVPSNERFGLGPFFRIEPLGMEYIAAALEARGHQVTIADLRFARAVEWQVKTARPGLVGIAGMHALETDNVLELASRVRRASPHVPIVVGVHGASEKRSGISRRGMTADDDGDVRRRAAHA
jgi:hopanoid C-3 methylase